MFATPAYAATGAGAAGGVGLGLVGLLPWIAILFIFYWFMIRPQQQRVRAHQAMVQAVKPRDTAITNGGLIGKVVKVDDNEVELEIAQGVKVRVIKSMLSDVRPHGTKAAND
jgi:preprotein translocase subunit YajC